MDRTDTPGQHWDRDQMERDTDGVPAGEQGDVWNRHQMEFDDTGTDRTLGTTADAKVAGDADALSDPDAGGLSGHGRPSGESHFERNDPPE